MAVARAAAAMGRRVILLDANIADPALAQLAGYRSVPRGLAKC